MPRKVVTNIIETPRSFPKYCQFMKSTYLLIALLPLFLLGRAGFGQDEGPKPIRVTETLHSDGTRTVMKSDPDNHSAESTTYDAANKLKQRVVFTLDEQGQAVAGVAYSPKGVFLYKTTYKHDASNHVTEVDTYTKEDKLLSRTVYKYDATGRVSGVDTYDMNGNRVAAPPAGGATPRRNPRANR